MIEGIVAIAFMLIALLVRALNDAYIYIYVFYLTKNQILNCF